jgi:hypothetical protein
VQVRRSDRIYPYGSNAGSGPMPLLVRPSLVDVAGSAQPSLLRRKEPTLAVMVVVCFLGKRGLVALLLYPFHEHVCLGSASGIAPVSLYALSSTLSLFRRWLRAPARPLCGRLRIVMDSRSFQCALVWRAMCSIDGRAALLCSWRESDTL